MIAANNSGHAFNPLGMAAGALDSTLALRCVKYGYSNARTKAMYTTFLSKKELDQLVEAKNVEEIVAFLQRTYYGPDMVEQAFEFSRADLVEISLGKNFSRTLKKIVKFSPKTDSVKIKRIFERYDVLNIKALLLGIHLKEEKEKIRLLLLESPSFSHAMLKRLLDTGSVKALVEGLKGTEYFAPLDRKMAEYENSHEIEALTLALESHYYKKFVMQKSAGFSLEKAIRDSLVLEIDAKNIMLVLRGKKEGFAPEKTLSFLLEGGKIRKETLKKMAQAKSVEEAAQLQGAVEFGDAIALFKNDSSLVHFERAIEKELSKISLRRLRTSVLSLSALVGFLFLKEKEMRTIRKIVRTKDFGFNPKEIMEIVA